MIGNKSLCLGLSTGWKEMKLYSEWSAKSSSTGSCSQVHKRGQITRAVIYTRDVRELVLTLGPIALP